MTDEELIAFAADFRDGILDGKPSDWMCAAICWPLAPLLRLQGVECECVESDLGHCNHVWIKLADGRVLDPTGDQFNHFNDCDFPAVYLGAPTVIHLMEAA
ncbi:hypothetical protein WMC41_16040 [Shinella yambaruensis]|uniref:hypothetical protein n=1 Tax=Shinella yambaruensis TaxID=415996 RepID=UPI003D7A54CC